VQLGNLLGGSVVIETVFALDGLGYLAYQSISHLEERPSLTGTQWQN
jgi:ABC-type dipeptide/oligopeptide/nickel transport system permease component